MDKAKVYYLVGGTIDFKYYVAQTQVVVSGTTVSIYDSGGAAIVEGATASVDGSGTMSYTLTSSQCTTEGEGFRAEWVFVYNSETIRRIDYFDCVDAGGFYPTWGRADLLYYDSKIGTQFSNSQLDSYCSGALQMLTTDITNKGYELNLIKAPEYFKNAGIYRTLANIYFDNSKSETDVWAYKYKEFSQRYNELMTKIFFYIDQNRDEVIINEEADTRVGGWQWTRNGWN